MTGHRELKDVDGLRRRLLRRALRLTADRATAEDMAQEALLRVWTRLGQDPPVAEPERYLMVTLRNIALKRRRLETDLDDATMPSQPPVAGDRLAARRVVAAISDLPEPQARLLRDHALRGLSFRDLAERDGVPIGTVMSRVARGRARLCARLGLPRDAPVAALLDRIA